MLELRITCRYDNVDAASVLEADQETIVYQVGTTAIGNHVKQSFQTWSSEN